MALESLVIDTNVLFSFFRKDSPTAAVITGGHAGTLKLFTPELARTELKKYKPLICSKSGILPEDFDLLLALLEHFVEHIPFDEYKEQLTEAAALADKLTLNEKAEFFDDIDFFALSLTLHCPIWSNDKLLKKQQTVDVLSTGELLSKLDLP